jgi:hypothetical protein
MTGDLRGTELPMVNGITCTYCKATYTPWHKAKCPSCEKPEKAIEALGAWLNDMFGSR